MTWQSEFISCPIRIQNSKNRRFEEWLCLRFQVRRQYKYTEISLVWVSAEHSSPPFFLEDLLQCCPLVKQWAESNWSHRNNNTSFLLNFNHFFDKICALLRYYAAQNGNCAPTFRYNLSIPSSKVKKSKKTNYALKVDVHSSGERCQCKTQSRKYSRDQKAICKVSLSSLGAILFLTSSHTCV
jgi:hypothetical protein